MPHTAPATQADAAPLETRFAAMGSTVHVVVVDGPADALADARTAIEALERRWSRFQPDSEVSRLNAAGGHPVTVSTATATLIALAVRGWTATAGAFDPTVLDAVVNAGYDRPFNDMTGQGTTGDDAAPTPAPGCDRIVIEGDAGAVRLPRGVRIDPGGIGKGLAADIVTTMLVDEGAAGALVNVGGDVRVAGRPATGGWRIDVDLPTTVRHHLVLRSGAIATSSTRRRRWIRDGHRMHHLIDPRTGTSLKSPFVAAMVVAGSAWWAEVFTKAALLARSVDAATQVLTDAGAAGLLVEQDGGVHRIADVERFER